MRVHPETGRKALYVNTAHTVGIEGLTAEESAPILGYLYHHQIRPEFTCRFRWRPGSLAFWDNRCAQHNAINDYQGHRRLLHRITLAGDKPELAGQELPHDSGDASPAARDGARGRRRSTVCTRASARRRANSSA